MSKSTNWDHTWWPPIGDHMETKPTITDFLLARIAEDEAVARTASSPAPQWEIMTEETADGQNVFYTIEPVRPHTSEPYIAELRNSGRDGYAYATHIARHDPARVLGECAAKRAIIGQHERYGDFGNGCCTTCADWLNENYDRPDNIKFPCPTLRALAAVYSDHPDYQSEWSMS